MCSLLRIYTVIFLLIKYTSSQDLVVECETGWINIVGKCYLIVPYTHSWERARQHCSLFGAVLAQPSGYHLSDSLTHEVQKHGIDRFWIDTIPFRRRTSFSDVPKVSGQATRGRCLHCYNRVGHETEEGFVGYWSDGTSTGVEVGMWAPYQPDVTSGSCAYIGAQWRGQGRQLWHMTSCDDVMPYVCERTACPSDTFTCTNGRCVGYPNICDGHNDCGDRSDELGAATSACGCSQYFKTETGTVDFDSQDYVPDADCTFTIEVPAGKRIQIQFDRFDIEEKLDVLEIWDGPTILSGQLVARISGSSPGSFSSYISSKNFLVLRFLSDGSVQKLGFSFSWSTEFRCEMKQIGGVTVPATQTGYEKLLTNRQDVGDCQTECDRTANCWAFVYDVTKQVDRTCYMVQETPILQDDDCCDVYVKTCPGRSRVTAIDSFPMPGDSLVAEAGYQYIYTPLYPFLYVGNFEKTFTITVAGNQLITLQIMKLDLCCTDHITVYNGPGPTAGLLEVITKASEPGFILSTGNQLYVHMDLRQHWTCSGALLAYKTGCNIEMSSESGVVKSPGYDVGGYPDITSCTWKIMPTSGNSVKLRFIDFITEENMDFLEIYTGLNDQGEKNHSGNGYHGNNLPPTLPSSIGIFLRFNTSAIGSFKGFHASYSSGCPRISSEGLLVDPPSYIYHSPDTVELTCADGYLFGGSYAGEYSVILACKNDGTWNAASMPFCERGYCGFAPEIGNGFFVSGTGTRGGDVITYACNDGYVMRGSASVMCTSNNEWQEPPICLSPQCEDLSNQFPVDSITLIRGNGTEHESVLQITCPQYEELIGPKTLQCYSGEWKLDPPTCRPIPCAVFAVDNGDVDLTTPYVMGDDVAVTCNPGYRSSATSGSYMCGVDPIIKCENIDECLENVHGCDNATCTDTDGGYTCTCLSGYIPVGTSTTVCEDVDECGRGLALCDHTCTNTPGSYTCSCEAGYDMYTEAGYQGLELGTGEDGTKPWHRFRIGHSCVLKMCDAAPITSIDNGKALTAKTTFSYGDNVEYLCDIGFYVDGTRLGSGSVYCGTDGLWDNTPQCEYAYCTETYGADVVPQGSIRYNEMFQLTCTARNGEISVLQRHCGYDKATGTYRTAGDVLECPETECGQFPVIPGMLDTFYTPCTTYNCTVVFRCKPQYIRQGASPQGDQAVRCDENGNWALGSLHCEGGQCPDPGYPVNGYTTFSTWNHETIPVHTVENGSVAMFSCVQSGYEPRPVGNMACRLVGDNMAWTGLTELPTCVDIEPPVFENCPANDIYVESFGTPSYVEPYAHDNTAVWTLEVYPTNFRPGMTVSSSMPVTYIARDYAGNTASCRFRILIRDVTPPDVTCARPGVIIAQSTTQLYQTADYVTVDDPTAELISAPETVVVNYDAIGTNPIIHFVATDPADKAGSCSSQMRIDAPACTDGTLNVYNGQVDCTYQTANPGYSCTIQCDSNYVFYENPLEDTITATCSNGGAWSREMPVCTVTKLAHYQISFMFSYDLTSGVDAGCSAVYEQQISDQLFTLTSAFQGICLGVLTDVPNIDVTEAADPLSARIAASGDLDVILTLEITPQGLEQTQYAACASAILNALNNLGSAVDSIKSLSGSASCQQQVLLQAFSAQMVDSVYLCSSAAKPAQAGVNYWYCLACPPGTYSKDNDCALCPAGTYNDGYSATSCKPCPDLTNSSGVGLMYQKNCYDDCGLYMFSPDGKAPCVSCPRDTYWVSSTLCKACPTGTYTKGTGARSENDCFAACEPGTFSPDGLYPCNYCPRNYFQAASGATACVECNTGNVTAAAQSTSEADCISGYDRECSINPCNSGSCTVLRHIFFCNCSADYTGRYCETPITPCDVKPCINGGTCAPVNITDYLCACPARYSGKNCEVNEDDCITDPCQNNGTCIDQRDNYLCACPSYSGFYGNRCQINSQPCSVHPCDNDGVCYPQENYNRVCNCKSGYSGQDCQEDKNECVPDPCMNGAYCRNGDNDFTCNCPFGYTGKYCHLRDPLDTCPDAFCLNAKDCIDNYITDKRFCKCYAGDYYDEIDEECAVKQPQCNPICGPNGSCESYDGGYHAKCYCDVGYGGASCFNDVDFCAFKPCKNSGTCSDGLERYSCTCPLMGTGGSTCDDNVDGCTSCIESNTKSCTDMIDGYTCYCKDGFTGDYCEIAIPTCDTYPCRHDGQCSNPTAQEHVCACQAPWSGDNCDVETDNCLTGTECENGGTCLSTSDGFICYCPLGYIGSRCESEYDVCNRTQPCSSDDNTCINTHSGTRCTCDRAYTGESCETLLWYCSDTTCKNDGICRVVNNVGTQCTCLVGFTGQYCEINVDECATKTCPSNSECRDGINRADCVCTDGKMGENCDKSVATDFDYIVTPATTCVVQLNYLPFTLDTTTELSVAFWFRFTILNSPSSIVTIYGDGSSGSSGSQYRIQMSETSVMVDIPTASGPIDSKTLLIEGVNIVDGLWHHVALTWNSVNGYLTLFIDGAYNSGVIVAREGQISNRGTILLGSETSEAAMFHGRFSQVLVLSAAIEDEVVGRLYARQNSQSTNLQSLISSSLLPKVNTTVDSMSINFNSQLTNDICTASTNCPDRAFSASAASTVASCPGDTLAVSERVSQPTWDLPTFSQTDPVTRKSTAVTGETTLGWGVHGISYAEYGNDNNAAVCTFRLYNKRSECEAGTTVENAVCPVSTSGDVMRCQLGCTGNAYAPSYPVPVYYTCSMYGSWDEADRTVDFVLPSCARSYDPSNTVTASFDYELLNCNPMKQGISASVTNAMVSLNTDWMQGLCKTPNGVSDVTCDVIDLQVICGSTDKATVTIVLRNLGGTVASMSQSVSPEDAMKKAIADDDTFTFGETGAPVLTSIVVQTTSSCLQGSGLIGDKCVDCGSGYFFSNSSVCEPCAVGSYRTVDSNTEPLSPCSRCSGSDTTDSIAAPAQTMCHDSCYLGHFYNATAQSCSPCPVGFYGDRIGASSCSPCTTDKTTASERSASPNACVAFARLTSSTAQPTDQPGIGASTGEEAGLSAGEIAAIVICLLIFFFVIAVILFLWLTKRLPCFAKVKPSGDTPWKNVNKYGETNLRFVNYRLSDVKENRKGQLERLPIYPDPPTPPEDTLSITRTDISVHVPIFNERMNGNIHKKRTYISTGPLADYASDLERTLDMPPSEYAPSEGTGHPASLFSESGRASLDYQRGVKAATMPSYMQQRRVKKGRPPTDLSHTARPLPRSLSPMGNTSQIPTIHTSEFIRSLPAFERQRRPVELNQYQEFLETPPRPVRPRRPASPPPSQGSSSKILLDSDQEDYR